MSITRGCSGKRETRGKYETEWKEKENMKKIIKAGLCVAAAAVIVTGCGNKSQNTESSSASEEQAAAATVETETKSEEELHDEESVTLGDYKNLTYSAKVEEVTDEQVQTRLKELCAEYPVTIEGRPAAEGDTANIDYSGTKDGVAFDGGTAEGYDLKLGSGTFIDGFEDGVIGMNVGDEKDLNLKFPDNYGSADLAGQEVVFHVKLNQLKSESDSKVDDDLAKRYYNDDTATLDQLKEEVCADLQAEADSQFFNAAGSELLNEVINNSEVTADPDAVDDMFNQLKTTYSSYASSYGLDFDQFLSMFLGTDEDGLRDTAENLVKQQLVLDAIQAQENLSATEDQKDKLAVMNYFKNAVQMTATYGEDSANQIFDMGAVYYYLIDNSTYVEAPETTAETTEAENILEEAETVAEESESSTEAK